jgi:hypothetical protein
LGIKAVPRTVTRCPTYPGDKAPVVGLTVRAVSSSTVKTAAASKIFSMILTMLRLFHLVRRAAFRSIGWVA